MARKYCNNKLLVENDLNILKEGLKIIQQQIKPLIDYIGLIMMMLLIKLIDTKIRIINGTPNMTIENTIEEKTEEENENKIENMKVK